jgi:hypothetical protein
MAWLPAGPTASEAAQIIPLFVLVLGLRSFSLCVRFRCLITALVVPSAPVDLQSATPASTDTLVKDRLRFLCDRDTRETIPSAPHSAGPWVRLHYNGVALRRCLHTCN